MGSAILLACENVSCAYGQHLALGPVSLSIGAGEFVGIVGPSGCGKTSLLRVLSGAMQPSSGALRTFGRESLRALLVRQEDSLFPWMTALDNACFGLRMLGVESRAREEEAKVLFQRFGLAGFEHAYPSELSAGMKQRVAVIRGVISKPDLLLMDEPFGALDYSMRQHLQNELLELWPSSGAAVVFVTHDIDEAVLLCDRVYVLRGSPGELAEEVRVDFPRPRQADTSQFYSVRRRIMKAGNAA